MTPAYAIPQTRPISDLRSDLGGICDQAAQSRAPIFMTKNGHATLVLMDCDTYEAERQHERYVLKLREAEIEAKYRPSSISTSELDKTIEHTLSTYGV